MHRTWSRAEQFRSCKESHEIFPQDMPLPRRFTFTASYEKEEPSIGLLLGWEYGRLWLKEHKENMQKHLSKAKPVFIEPDFSWWVNKRAAVIDRRQIFLKNKQSPHFKNCNLTAFATLKTIRQKRKRGSASSGTASGDEAAKMTKSEKAKKCNCKDCMQRRCGGEEKGKVQKVDIVRKSIPTPWY